MKPDSAVCVLLVKAGFNACKWFKRWFSKCFVRWFNKWFNET